jgi:DNA-binding transcriptional LysR family regulator
MDLEIDLLRSFVTVAETRHFTLAAQRLNRTQSAVSMQVKRLEQVVGARLFSRTKRMVRLTAEGEAFRRYANRMLRLNDETLAHFGRPSLQGRVRVGATDTSMCFLPPVLSRFAQAYPLIEFEIRCERSWEALDALDAGEVDLALVTQPCGRTGGETVRRDPLAWAAAQGSVADEIDPLPLALFGPGCIYREAALRALEGHGRAWRHAYNSPSRDGLDVAVSAGLAVTIIPESALPATWRILKPESGFPDLPDMEILMYRARDDASGPASAFADAVTETLRAGL